MCPGHCPAHYHLDVVSIADPAVRQASLEPQSAGAASARHRSPATAPSSSEGHWAGRSVGSTLPAVAIPDAESPSMRSVQRVRNSRRAHGSSRPRPGWRTPCATTAEAAGSRLAPRCDGAVPHGSKCPRGESRRASESGCPGRTRTRSAGCATSSISGRFRMSTCATRTCAPASCATSTTCCFTATSISSWRSRSRASPRPGGRCLSRKRARRPSIRNARVIG